MSGADGRTNWRATLAVVRRDLRIVRGSKPVMIPMLLVPVLLLVVMPLGVAWGARLGGAGMDMSDIEPMLAQLPGDVTARLADDPVAGLIEIALVYLLSPMLLIVPLMTASVIAADAVAGERERKTLEGLLLTPLTDRELLIAKLLGAWLPAVVIGVGGGIFYAVVADLASLGAVEGLLFPNTVWLVLVFWVGPAVAAVGLGATVLVSARVKTVQEAFQIAGVVVVPIVVLVVGQSAGLLVLSPLLLFAAGAVGWVIAAAVLWAGADAVSRARLGERL
jgi:ABC-2 type transport system permease protein